MGRGTMNEKLESLGQAALLFAVVFVLAAVGIAIVRRVRDSRSDDIGESSEMMTKFRDLHDQGGLSDEEFRTIKTKLAGKLRSELGDSPRPTETPTKGN